MNVPVHNIIRIHLQSNLIWGYLGPLGEGVEGFLLQQLGNGGLAGIMEAVWKLTHGEGRGEARAGRVGLHHRHWTRVTQVVHRLFGFVFCAFILLCVHLALGCLNVRLPTTVGLNPEPFAWESNTNNLTHNQTSRLLSHHSAQLSFTHSFDDLGLNPIECLFQTCENARTNQHTGAV